MSKRYPRTESEFAALALRVAEGLAQHPEDFPNPPVSAADLKAKWEVFNAADTATVAAKDAYLGQHAVKDDAFEDMEDATKSDLRYAEVAVRPGSTGSSGSGRAVPGRTLPPRPRRSTW